MFKPGNPVRRLVQSKPLLIVIATAIISLSGLVVYGLVADGDGPGNGAAQPDPGGSGSGAGAGNAGDGGSGGNGSSGTGGATTGGAGLAGAGGSSDDPTGSDGPGTGGDGGGGPAGSLPPPGGECGPREFLGGLIPFIQTLGDPNLLPPSLKILKEASDSADLVNTRPNRVLGRVGTVLSAPVTVLSGFNETYGMIADLLPDRCGSITGDPHVFSMDGKHYDFHATGEYWAFRSDDRSFGVQVRLVPYSISERASSVAGVATRIGGRLLVVDHTADDFATVDGGAVAVGDSVLTDDGGAILYLEEGIAVFWPDGQTTLTITQLQQPPALSVHFTIGEALHQRVAGLMGNVDGDRDNDLAMPDGTVISATFEDLQGPYRDAWRVANSDMWFAGPSRFRPDFPSERALLEPSEVEAAREVCVESGVVVGSLIEDCTFDVAIGQDAELAQIHATNQRSRIQMLAPECELELSSETTMEGFGNHRHWRTRQFELAGEIAWSFVHDGGEEPRIARVLSAGDTAVVLDTNNGVHLIDRTGAPTETVELAVLPDVEPLVVGNSVYVATEEGLAASSLDGAICWHLIMHSDEDVATLGLDDDVIVVTTAADSGQVSLALALDRRTGGVLWEKPIQANVRQFGANTAPPLFGGIGVFEASAGKVTALSLEDGEEIWVHEPARPSIAIHGLAATEEGTLVASRASGITLLDSDTGEVIWTRDSNVGVPGALAVHPEYAVILGGAGVQAFDLETGEVEWVNPEVRQRNLDQQHIISGDLILTYSADRLLLSLDIETGAEVARLDADTGSDYDNTNAQFVSTPVVFGDVILTVDLAGGLSAYR